MLNVGITISAQISPQANEFVKHNIKDINGIFDAHNAEYKIVAESTQLVNGTNHFLHLIGQPYNQKYTITVFIGQQGPSHII